VVALAEQYESVYAAVGIHPNSTAEWQDNWLGVLRDLARHEKVVAIGEIGLDYYWDRSPRLCKSGRWPCSWNWRPN
jgi:TatD DNase family protein